MIEKNTNDNNRNVYYFLNLRKIAYFLFLLLYNGVLLAQNSTVIFITGGSTIIDELEGENLKEQPSKIYLTNDATIVDSSVIKNYDLNYVFSKKERGSNHKLIVYKNKQAQITEVRKKRYNEKKKNDVFFFRQTSEQQYFNSVKFGLDIGLLSDTQQKIIEHASDTLFDVFILFHKSKFSVSFNRIKNNSFSESYFTRPPPLIISS